MSAKSAAALVLLAALVTLGLSITAVDAQRVPPGQFKKTPTLTVTPSPSPTPSPTPSSTLTVTPTPSPSPTLTPTPTPTDTDTPTATETVTETVTSTVTPTGTQTATPTDTFTPIPTDTPTFTPTETSTNTPTVTETATPIPTNTPTGTETSTPSPSATSTPTAIPTLLPPANVITTPQHYRVGFSWTSASGATAVVIEQMVSGGAWVPVASVLVGTTFPVWVNGLECYTPYEFRLKSYRAGDGQYSDYIIVSTHTWPCEATATPSLTTIPTNTNTPTTTPMPTETPSNNPTAVWTGQVVLNWTDNSTDESEFRIERSSDGNTWTEIATVPTNTTTYTDADPSLMCGTTYYYRVRAYRASDGQFSAYSGTASVSIPACEGTPTTEPPTPTYGPADVYHPPFSLYGCLSGSDVGWTPEPCPYGTPIPLARSGVPTDTLGVGAALLCENSLIYDFGARGDDRITSLSVSTISVNVDGYQTPEPTNTLPNTPTRTPTTTRTPTATPTGPWVSPTPGPPTNTPTATSTRMPTATGTPTATPPPGSGTLWEFSGLVNGQTHVARFECWAGWDWIGLSVVPYLRLDWLN